MFWTGGSATICLQKVTADSDAKSSSRVVAALTYLFILIGSQGNLS